MVMVSHYIQNVCFSWMLMPQLTHKLKCVTCIWDCCSKHEKKFFANNGTRWNTKSNRFLKPYAHNCLLLIVWRQGDCRSRGGCRCLGLDQRHWEGEKWEEKKETMVPCSPEDVSSVKAIHHGKLACMRLPFAVRCYVCARALFANSPGAGGRLVGNLLC